MKLTDMPYDVPIRFNGDCVTNRAYVYKKVIGTPYLYDQDGFLISCVLLICREDWELVETTYTQREAFKMLSEGKVMGYLGSFYKFVNDHLMRFYNDGSTDIMYNLEDLEDPSVMWTEYKEEK